VLSSKLVRESGRLAVCGRLPVPGLGTSPSELLLLQAEARRSTADGLAPIARRSGRGLTTAGSPARPGSDGLGVLGGAW